MISICFNSVAQTQPSYKHLTVSVQSLCKWTETVRSSWCTLRRYTPARHCHSAGYNSTWDWNSKHFTQFLMHLLPWVYENWQLLWTLSPTQISPAASGAALTLFVRLGSSIAPSIWEPLYGINCLQPYRILWWVEQVEGESLSCSGVTGSRSYLQDAHWDFWRVLCLWFVATMFLPMRAAPGPA